MKDSMGANQAAATSAIEAIPFSGWDNETLKSAVYPLIEALGFEWDDPRRNVLLASSASILSRVLAEGITRNLTLQKSLAQRVNHAVTGNLLSTEEIDDPKRIILSAVEQQERKAVR